MTRASEPSLRRSLLRWFDAHRRDLPWRRDRSPYRVWLSEVMLQQTQVATVIPYFERFLARFPTVEDLARAQLPEVLGLWTGLGYYSRARNLHRAAQIIALEGMPRTARTLRSLPGFGPYTAAAVASLAFGEPVALVDGNVARVLARVYAIEDEPGSREREKLLWARAETLLDRQRPGAFNEALMELGALVCVPVRPKCDECPLAGSCQARRLGVQERIPPPKPRAAREKLTLACAVIRAGERVLLARRPEAGLFGGLWEMPCAPLAKGLSGPRALATLGLAALGTRAVAVVRRTLSHRDLALRLFPCRAPTEALPGYLEQRLFAPQELAGLGMATAMRKAVASALQATRTTRSTR